MTTVAWRERARERAFRAMLIARMRAAGKGIEGTNLVGACRLVIGIVMLTSCSTSPQVSEALPGTNGSVEPARAMGSNRERAGGTATDAGSRSDAPVEAVTPAPGSGAGPCPSLMARFDAVLKVAPGTCATDADCACYPDLRIDGRLAVSDRATAAALELLSNRYRKQQCPTIFESTARPPTCTARCSSGVCR